MDLEKDINHNTYVEIFPNCVLADQRRPLDHRQAFNWYLALASRAIDSRLQKTADGWRLYVPIAQQEQAIAELRLLEEENRHWPPVPPVVQTCDNGWNTACILAGLALFHNLTRLSIPTLGLFPDRWLMQGCCHAGKVLAGEWWRLCTALTLHSDTLHLLSNLLIGGIFVDRLCRRIGTGRTWALLLLCGMIGNLLDCLVQPPSHRAVGASTAIFAAIGLLAAGNTRDPQSRSSKPWFLPLAAGLALLGLLGVSGEHTDLAAHLFGFASGLLAGWLLVPLLSSRPPFVDRVLDWIAAGLISGSWLLALFAPA
jgi:membrane associated rhomboid family serine protease